MNGEQRFCPVFFHNLDAFYKKTSVFTIDSFYFTALLSELPAKNSHFITDTCSETSFLVSLSERLGKMDTHQFLSEMQRHVTPQLSLFARFRTRCPVF